MKKSENNKQNKSKITI